MSTETAFYARFDDVSSDEWEMLEKRQSAEDLVTWNAESQSAT